TLTSAIGAPLLPVTRPVKLAVGPAWAGVPSRTKMKRRNSARRNGLRPYPLGMVRIGIQIGVQQLLAIRFRAASWRLDCDKNGVDLGQDFGVVELEDPAVLLLIVDVKHSQALRRFLSGFALSPGLKGGAGLQIEG